MSSASLLQHALRTARVDGRDRRAQPALGAVVAATVRAIAGSLAAKKRTPPGAGTLPTHTPLFVALLVAVVIIVGALTFIPALALGPIAEHLSLL